MFWTGAKEVYETCERLGLCRSQRDFSRRLLGRGPHYLRLVTNRRTFVSERTTRTLRSSLMAIRASAPNGIASEIDLVLLDIDRAEQMAMWLRRR